MRTLSAVMLYLRRPLACAAVVIATIVAANTITHAADIRELGKEAFKALHAQQNYPMPVSWPEWRIGFDADTPAECNHYIASPAACYQRGVIWVTPALLASGDEKLLSALVHESVHHLQHERHGDAMNCQQNLDREREAYKAQQIFMSENFHKYIGTHSIGTCTSASADGGIRG